MVVGSAVGAVQRYQIECPPALPAWLGSPDSLVALALLPVSAPELPVKTGAAAKAAVAGGGGAFTDNTNVSAAVLTPSLTVTLIVAVPVWLAAGVTVTVRLPPLPPKTMFASGTNVGLDELPLRVKLPAAVSTSPTVKLIGPTATPAVVF